MGAFNIQIQAVSECINASYQSAVMTDAAVTNLIFHCLGAAEIYPGTQATQLLAQRDPRLFLFAFEEIEEAGGEEVGAVYPYGSEIKNPIRLRIENMPARMAFQGFCGITPIRPDFLRYCFRC